MCNTACLKWFKDANLYFDWIYFIGLILLSILWPLSDQIKTFEGAQMEIWYILLSVFMAFACLKRKSTIKYFGFLDSIFYKSSFYLFISSFALADMTNLYATTIGVIFVLTAIVNLARTPDFEKPKRAENRLNMTNMTDMSFTSYRSNKSMVSDGTKAI